MWKQSADGRRWRRPLPDGTRAVASQLSDQSFAVSVNFRYVLSGYTSLPDVMRDFDSFHSPLEGAFDYAKARIGRVYKRRPRRVRPVAETVKSKGACTDSAGHYFLLPRPQKGSDGVTSGECRYCGLTRAMLNVEGPASWRTVRVTAMI